MDAAVRLLVALMVAAVVVLVLAGGDAPVAVGEGVTMLSLNIVMLQPSVSIKYTRLASSEYSAEDYTYFACLWHVVQVNLLNLS